MSGHSKWATIKHKKGALDAKRGKIFTRLLKEIAVAAKGGGNPDTNARLRTAVLAAKAENMPQDNIKRAIQRGTGELEGLSYEEITFEGYGPGGVAIIVEVTTDNRNRAVSEIRHAFSKNGGNLGETGSVRFMFHKKGLIAIEKDAATEEQLMDIVLEHGGEDLNDEGDTWEIITDPADYETVAAAVKAAGIPTVMSEVTMVASTYTKLEGTAANQMIRLLEVLEDCDDTQNVYSNFDMDADQMEAGRITAGGQALKKPPVCGGFFVEFERNSCLEGMNIDPKPNLFICWPFWLATTTGFAQSPNSIVPMKPVIQTLSNASDNPVAQVRANKSWEYGPFINGGMGVGNRSQYKFLWAGYQLGKPLTPVFHAGILSGQFELAGNIMPLWQAYTPAPHTQNYICADENGQPFTCSLQVGGGTFHGVSLTPVISALEFSDQFTADSAMVSGRRRADLYHPRFSAELSKYPDHQRTTYTNSTAEPASGISRPRAASAFTFSPAPSGPSTWA